MKIGLIGMGWVGSSVAFSVLQSGLARALFLNDIKPGLAEGEALDLGHGAPFLPACQVSAVDLEGICAADAVVIAVGQGGAPGGDRLALLEGNADNMLAIGAALRGYTGLVVVVTNPVDVMTQLVCEASGLDPARVIGTGTMLDTARLRQALGRELRVDPHSVNAAIIGEHGFSAVPLWSCAEVGGRRLRDWEGWTAEREARVGREVRDVAQKIVARKGATNHAIGLVATALLSSLLRDERRVYCVSRVQAGGLGLQDVALSLPTIVGAQGAVEVVAPSLDAEERQLLERSAEALRAARARLGPA